MNRIIVVLCLLAFTSLATAIQPNGSRSHSVKLHDDVTYKLTSRGNAYIITLNSGHYSLQRSSAEGYYYLGEDYSIHTTRHKNGSVTRHSMAGGIYIPHNIDNAPKIWYFSKSLIKHDGGNQVAQQITINPQHDKIVEWGAPRFLRQHFRRNMQF